MSSTGNVPKREEDMYAWCAEVRGDTKRCGRCRPNFVAEYGPRKCIKEVTKDRTRRNVSEARKNYREALARAREELRRKTGPVTE